MSSPSQPQVLVVGSGPTGLVLAIELRRRGIDCRIIDRRGGPSDTSRSFTLHSRTMMMFDDMGISERYLADGIKNKGFVFNFKGIQEKPVLDFTKLPGRHPYILVYNQCDAERNLREHVEKDLGLRIEWNTGLVSLDSGSDCVEVELEHNEDGRRESIRPTWLVGADGIHSTVRKTLDLPYEGDNYEGMVMQMMDAPMTAFPDGDDWCHYYMERENFLLVTKLPGGNYRVLISDMGEIADSGLSAQEGFQGVVDRHLKDVTIETPKWNTEWEIWKRLAKTFRQGRVFLAGDSAHVHSPSGGQGMNAGMQDAYNLGWKLAMVVRGEAKESLLDSYQPERQPIADQVIRGTDAMHDIIMWHGQGMEERMALTQKPEWNEKATQRISGLSYTYRDTVDLPSELRDLAGPAIGDLAPDVALSNAKWLNQLTHHAAFTLLVFPGADNDGSQLLQVVRQRYGDRVRPTVVSADLDPVGAARQIYEIGTFGGLCLIRPDGYIGWRCGLDDPSSLTQHLDRILVPA